MPTLSQSLTLEAPVPYRINKQRLLAFHGDRHFVWMYFADPPVDFTVVARSLGLEAIRITRPDELDQPAPDSGGPGRGYWR